ncbi:hypothetical protein BZA77DRAFT_313831 [Pyronema omphalodes]|nr:hypothetical protein BZA77DRAFT_313831 [Pyronema omphalodes]
MRSILNIILTGVFVAVVTAAPSVLNMASNGVEEFNVSGASSSTKILERGGVYYCDDVFFGKLCTYGLYPIGACMWVSDEFNDIISSFRPDQGTSCTVYE